MLRYTATAYQRTNEYIFLPIISKYNDKISRTYTKQQADFRSQKAHSLTALFYSKEFHNVYKSWGLTEETRLYKASIDGPKSLLSRKCRTNSPRIKRIEESVPNSRGICTTATEQCPEFNNTKCVLSYTSIGDRASNRSWPMFEQTPTLDPKLFG